MLCCASVEYCYLKVRRKWTVRVCVQVCTPCHAQCMECIDASNICEVCVGVREERRCKTSCSPDYYLNVTTMTCERCDRLCLQCYGPTHFHCISCRQYVLYHGPAEANGSVSTCCILIITFDSIWHLLEIKTTGAQGYVRVCVFGCVCACVKRVLSPIWENKWLCICAFVCRP